MPSRTPNSEPARGRALFGLLATLAVCGAVAADEPRSEPTAAAEAPAVAETQRSQRLREIDGQLAQDKQRLVELLAQPVGPDSPPLRLDPELRAIAERMPRLQAARRLWSRDPEAAAAAEAAPGTP